MEANNVAWKILNGPDFTGRISIAGDKLIFHIAGTGYFVGNDDQADGSKVLNVVRAYQRKHGEIK